jgi:hypothetical protein
VSISVVAGIVAVIVRQAWWPILATLTFGCLVLLKALPNSMELAAASSLVQRMARSRRWAAPAPLLVAAPHGRSEPWALGQRRNSKAMGCER